MTHSLDAFRARTVLVTGATGRVGRHLVPMLTSRGFTVRAQTRRPSSTNNTTKVDWRQADFEKNPDFSDLVSGCDAVIHLAAEVWNIPQMKAVNVEASRGIAAAAVAAGVEALVFTSSVAVYGSPHREFVDEETPTVTAEQDVVEEYRGNASIRAYARSKVMAERAIAEAGSSLAAVIFRPTIIVDDDGIRAVRDMSGLRRAVEGQSRTHHIHVADVCDALCWGLERAWSSPKPGAETFNLSDNDVSCSRYRDLFDLALRHTNDPGYRSPFKLPLFAYDLADALKNRTLSKRIPLGKMNISSQKLYDAGYRFPTGICAAYRHAFRNQALILQGKMIG